MKCEICGKIIWGLDWFNIKYTSRDVEDNDRKWEYGGYSVWENVYYPKKNGERYAHVKCVIKKAKEEEAKREADSYFKMLREGVYKKDNGL